MVVFYGANGAPSTRFTTTRVHNGRVEYSGTFLFDGSIVHTLSEVDVDINTKVWRFWRKRAGEPDFVIDDKVRLLADHTLDGHRHPNEAMWGIEGDTLVFYFSDGRGSTRFSTFRGKDGVMSYEGTFLADPSITHVLEERGPGWKLGSTYVAWLPYAPAGRERILP